LEGVELRRAKPVAQIENDTVRTLIPGSEAHERYRKGPLAGRRSNALVCRQQTLFLPRQELLTGHHERSTSDFKNRAILQERRGTVSALAETLSKARTRRKLSMNDVSRQSSIAKDHRGRITQGYISRLESGKETNPSFLKLQTLCNIYRINPGTLFKQTVR